MTVTRERKIQGTGREDPEERLTEGRSSTRRTRLRAKELEGLQTITGLDTRHASDSSSLQNEPTTWQIDFGVLASRIENKHSLLKLSHLR